MKNISHIETDRAAIAPNHQHTLTQPEPNPDYSPSNSQNWEHSGLRTDNSPSKSNNLEVLEISKEDQQLNNPGSPEPDSDIVKSSSGLNIQDKINKVEELFEKQCNPFDLNIS